MSEVTLVQAKKEDWKIIRDLEKGAESKYFHATMTEKEEIQGYIDNNEISLIIQNNEKIGLIGFEELNDSFYIFDLIIRPRFQGKGIGKETIEIIIRKISQIAEKPITLVTHPENSRAVTLYLKSGFKIKRWEDNYFKDGEPRIVLER